MYKPYRKRYITFKILSDKKISREDFDKSLRNTALNFLGELNYSKAKIKILPEFWRKEGGVMSVDHTYVNEAKVCLALIKGMIVMSKKTYGTLKKIKKEGI